MNYQEADKIDKIIGTLLEKNPITKENALGWANFARSVESSIKILQYVIQPKLKIN